MKTSINSNQKLLLELLSDSSEGLTLREMAAKIGVGSPNTVMYHLRKLEQLGFLRKNAADPTGYEVFEQPAQEIMPVNLYGDARCGPDGPLGEDSVVDRIPISTRTFGVGEDVFLVTARGDSMEPYILEGDLVLARRRSDVPVGKIAVLVRNQQVLIKKITLLTGVLILTSLNSAYEPVVIEAGSFDEEGVRIVGEVRGIIRCVA